MKDTTKRDFERLTLYGHLYLQRSSTGKVFFTPSQIETVLEQVGSGGQIGDLIAQHDIQKVAHDAAVQRAVSDTFNAVGGMIPVFGSVLQFIGGIVSLILQAGNKDCDEALYSGADNQRLDKEWITGYNISAYEGRCYGRRRCTVRDCGSKDRFAELLEHTHDGMWFWRGDWGKCVPAGTVVGVNGRAIGGELAKCDHYFWFDDWTPRLGAPYADPKDIPYAGVPYAGSTLPHGNVSTWRAGPQGSGRMPDWAYSKEYLRRQMAVTLYLYWLRHNMDYSILSCMDSVLHYETNAGGGAGYRVCARAPSDCNWEESGCHEWQVARYVPNQNITVDWGVANRRLTASRWYCSVMSMFDNLLKMSVSIGKPRAAEILRQVGASGAAEVLLDPNKSGNVTQAMTEAWPAYYLAQHVTWQQLKNAVSLMGNEQQNAEQRAIRYGLPKPIRIDPVANLPRTAGLVPSYRPTWLPSTPVLIVGGGLLALGVYLWWRSSQEDEDHAG